MNTTEELPKGQQLLLQRLIAIHCVSSDETKRMFNSLMEQGIDDNDDTNFMGPGIDTFEAAFVSINRQLKPGFGLEIVTLVDSSSTNATENYHAVVNTTADEIAKKETVFLKSWNPHERAFVRLLIRAFVDHTENQIDGDDNDNDEVVSRNSSARTSVPGIRRADLINLRSELESGFKLTLDEATRVVGILLEEKWLRTSLIDDSEQSQRRESVQARIELAPRTYMELDHYLTNLGLDAGKLPQLLFHRD
jgi:hypothetical protein